MSPVISAPTCHYFAADTGQLSGDMQIDTSLYRVLLKSIAGDALSVANDEDNRDSHSQRDAAEYQFELSAASEWRLWGRLYCPGTAAQNDPDSFWASVDGAAPQVLGGSTDAYQRWHWEGSGERPLSLGHLAVGRHRLKVWNRQAGASRDVSPRLDMLALSNLAQAQPSDCEVLASLGPAKPPYPLSQVIRGIEWEPVCAMERAGVGDNYPLTWADDGHLYGCWGDGTGFDPSLPKLGFGLIRVEGGPKGFRPANLPMTLAAVRLFIGDTTGGGPVGWKGSGMLMVGGTLYLLVRNANRQGEQSQLLWSTDHAQTWKVAEWRFEEFGYPTFINFGRNHAGARDRYVYLVSPDSPNAYRFVDHFVLLRVPQDCIKEREAYECYGGRDAAGNPRWSRDLGARVPVFTNPGCCCRSGISYNAGLKRYLWWQHLPRGVKRSDDTRHLGGFGVYEAPEPWGPWATAYFTHCWDTGPGECASFPQKWMSEDGRTVYLAGSSENTFSVRKAVLQTGDEVSER